MYTKRCYILVSHVIQDVRDLERKDTLFVDIFAVNADGVALSIMFRLAHEFSGGTSNNAPICRMPT